MWPWPYINLVNLLNDALQYVSGGPQPEPPIVFSLF
jgi:hypothetical protein